MSILYMCFVQKLNLHNEYTPNWNPHHSPFQDQTLSKGSP